MTLLLTPLDGARSMKPGYLLAYGSSVNDIYHITIATDRRGYMIEAPRAGTTVREVPIRTQDLVLIKGSAQSLVDSVALEITPRCWRR